MSDATRRVFIQAAAAVVAAGSVASAVHAADDKKPSDPAFDDQHTPVALLFDAKSLNGISEKLIQSHWENNYGGAVKALNALRSRLPEALRDPNTPPYVYTGLKREQLVRTGSVVLHEAYFGNLGGNGKASADLRTRIGTSFSRPSASPRRCSGMTWRFT